MKYPFLAKFVRFAGILMLVLGGAMIKVSVRDPKEDAGGVFLFGACMAGLGIYLWRIARRALKVIEAKALSLDRRDPILYLRVFEDEEVSRKPRVPGFIVIAGLAFSIVPQDLNTEEEHLAGIFKYWGPFICIGRPKEKLPPLGALRYYFGDDWKEKIMELCSRARLIILRGNALKDPGKQEGFRFELKMVWSEIDRRKLVYLLPAKQVEVDSFLALLRDITKQEIPEVKVGWSADHFCGILYIDQAGQFQYQVLKKQYHRIGNVLSIRLKKTFLAAGVDLDNGLFARPALLQQLFAFLIDCGLLLILSSLIYVIVFICSGKAYPLGTCFMLTIAAYFFYCGIMGFTKSASTFGKRYYNIVILDKEKLKINIQQVMGRFILRLFTFSLLPLDILLMWLYGAHVHDFLTGTREYKVIPKKDSPGEPVKATLC